MYSDRNVQLSNAWEFANKGLINAMQLTELYGEQDLAPEVPVHLTDLCT